MPSIDDQRPIIFPRNNEWIAGEAQPMIKTCASYLLSCRKRQTGYNPERLHRPLKSIHALGMPESGLRETLSIAALV